MCDERTLPRPGSTMYPIMCGSKQERNKAVRKFKFWNKWVVVPLYKANILPLFGIGRIFVLLETRGRKTGKQRFTPLEYRKYKGSYLLFSSRGEKSHWFQNLLANPDAVRVKIGFKTFVPQIEVVENLEDRVEIMKWYVKEHPKAAKFLFGYDPKKDTPTTSLLMPVAEFIRIVKLTLPSTRP